MEVSLQDGLYELCRLRIDGDGEFLALTGRRPGGAVDDALFDEYRLFQLRRTLRLVGERSAFYRGLFAKSGTSPDDVESLSDLAKLPFTRPEDLAGNSYRFLCTSRGDVEKPVTFYSSGSTGLRKRVFFSSADIRKILDFLPRGMNTVIGRDECSAQIFLQNSMGRGIGRILADALGEFGMRACLSNLDDPPEEILRTAVENRVNVWFGDAITILRVTRILARRNDLASLGMKCIFLTMTNIPDVMIGYLGRVWNCRVSTHYGLTEMGWGLAVDCPACGGYHYNELDVIAEAIDPDTGELVPPGEPGELALTSISRDSMPLIRYRTGDISSLAPSRCGGHLEVMGHIRRRLEGAYDMGGGRVVYPAMFDEPIFALENVLDYRISARGEQLYVEAETLEEDPRTAEELAEALARLPALSGAPRPAVTLLPCGALRESCYEKKRILPHA